MDHIIPEYGRCSANYMTRGMSSVSAELISFAPRTSPAWRPVSRNCRSNLSTVLEAECFHEVSILRSADESYCEGLSFYIRRSIDALLADESDQVYQIKISS